MAMENMVQYLGKTCIKTRKGDVVNQ